MILLVDDNRMTSRVMEANLERVGLKVKCAADGETALAALQTTPEIDVVVTDLCMPGMDGIAFMDAIREQPELSTLPIIVASGSVDLETLKAVGLRDVRRVFVKPIAKDDLIREIQEAIEELDRLTLREECATLKELGLESEQYFEILGELAESLRGLIPKLESLVSADAPDDDAYTETQAALRNIAETVDSVASGKFMATLDHLATVGRPATPTDWCRVALRDARKLLAVADARIAEKGAEVEAKSPAEAPADGEAPTEAEAATGAEAPAGSPAGDVPAALETQDPGKAAG